MCVETVMGKVLARMWRCRSGGTAIEYSLVAALIAVVLISSLQLFGGSLADAFATIAANVQQSGGA